MPTNHVVIEGNIGKEPKISDYNVLLSIAHNENFKDKAGEWKKKTHWIPIKVVGKNKDKAAALLKGDHILVDGTMRVDEYEVKGEKKTFTYVQCFEVKKIAKLEDKKPAQDELFGGDSSFDIPF